MQLTKPQVFLAGMTSLDKEGLTAYLEEIGADKYELDPELTDLEELVRAGGKLCYRSWQPALNPNVTKTRDDGQEYIRDSILKAAHGSVLEHASVSFIFHNVSRVFTHELVRHRAGVAISQESLRYVRLTDLNFWMPKILVDLDAGGKGQALIKRTVEYLEGVQKELADIYKVDEANFAIKKKLTSAFRRVAPIGLGTGMLWTANVRALRHIILMRTDPSAEEEIRLVFDDVAGYCVKYWPAMFQDFKRELVDGYGHWTCSNPSNPYDRKG